MSRVGVRGEIRGRLGAVQLEVRKRIQKQLYGPGQRLPSERELSNEFEMPRVSLHECLVQLEAEGLIYRETNRGWYVSPPRFLYNPQSRGHFTQSAVEQGRRPSTRVIDKRLTPAPQQVSELLELATETELACIRRVRSIDGRPVLYVEHYFSPTVFPDLFEQDLSGSLTELYRDRYGFHYGRMRYQIIPTAVRNDAAKVLRLANGGPALLVRRVNHEASGRAKDCDLEYWRHDAVLVEVEVEN